ncbi:hypothetical protein PUR71_27675 [Streptomyces sp. SP17BM10]|uniref:hypothetical protein n=1 Tax=Streptomyces sp. SP17BM10 TaxID=3002530 RepID=UPI002E75AAC4|nr:hypothetical protein [Streptomyces sp. SP17BM10]MEE1786652.1 hypothetical protein [Streptomyces sp. SP17BM10]
MTTDSAFRTWSRGLVLTDGQAAPWIGPVEAAFDDDAGPAHGPIESGHPAAAGTRGFLGLVAVRAQRPFDAPEFADSPALAGITVRPTGLRAPGPPHSRDSAFKKSTEPGLRTVYGSRC